LTKRWSLRGGEQPTRVKSKRLLDEMNGPHPLTLYLWLDNNPGFV